MSLLADWQLPGPLLVLWPFRRDVWRACGLPAQQQLLRMAEQLTAITNNSQAMAVGLHPQLPTSALPQAHINRLSLRYNDAWPRDIGPLWVQENEGVVAHGFRFSAWHGLYPDTADDQAFAATLSQQLSIPFTSHPDLVLEGGAVSTDGAGVAVVHGASILRNNPDWTQTQIEQYLLHALQLQRIYWLTFAHPADETGGHADNHVQFASEDTVVCALPQPCDPLYADYQQQLEAVRNWRNANGQPYHVVVLPQPPALVPVASDYVTVSTVDGVYPRGKHPLLASYVNFVRGANYLLVPQFQLPEDAQACALLQQALPNIAVIPVNALEFIKAGGAIHCMTLPLPRAIAKA